MKKLYCTMTAALLLAALMQITAFAGTWESTERGWWYDRGDGTYPALQWEWIDGNGDGTAECYYFDEEGYLLTSTVTPDGSKVNGNGCWTVYGKVQEKSAEEAEARNSQVAEAAAEAAAKSADEQERALAAAKDLVSAMSYSRQEVIEELVKEGFSEAAAAQAADACGADWNAQAVKAAQMYLSLDSGWTRRTLYEMLEYEAFEGSQITEALNTVGLTN